MYLIFYFIQQLSPFCLRRYSRQEILSVCMHKCCEEEHYGRLNTARYQASAAAYYRQRPSPFWEVTHRTLIVGCRHIGRAYQSHLDGQAVQDCLNLRCITSQKRKGLKFDTSRKYTPRKHDVWLTNFHVQAKMEVRRNQLILFWKRFVKRQRTMSLIITVYTYLFFLFVLWLILLFLRVKHLFGRTSQHSTPVTSSTEQSTVFNKYGAPGRRRV